MTKKASTGQCYQAQNILCSTSGYYQAITTVTYKLVDMFVHWNETERKKQLVHKKTSLKLIITLYTGDGSELSVSIQYFLNKSFKALKMHIFLLIIF